MTTLYNEIIIDAPIDKIWDALSSIEELEKYDPTVKSARALSAAGSGIGATRKVGMKDGKNWFEEKVTVWKKNEALAYELTACSFPIQQLKHSYGFEQIGHQTKVKQVMEYKVKYGLIGKVLDALMIRRQSDTGIKKFFVGLKSYTDRQ
ncbi:SRPBCC family protein [Dinghuibacter silviterrae]|uniref:Polyketide cyclase/dehydrase/lipid transport protein n=1 Tax=Dinghuibacter silviterrae TaxID=1539049 RepID=A0A4R8DPL3_9BACT|nr:SRPBCC family protein [Dinghuibacter silviterrae]TDW99060.1 polyketide cyclase/dehydrase/lipid transport protein [Dinghuibacter silviterrae]